MKYSLLSFIIICVITGILLVFLPKKSQNRLTPGHGSMEIKLSQPVRNSKTSIEKALLNRRSIRSYKNEALKLSDISQLLWAAQGITDSRGFRTAPSAGALYPVELYLAAGNVQNLPEGIYKYRPLKHELVMIAEGDIRNRLSSAALGQPCVRNSAAVIVISVVYERVTVKYMSRGIRYVHIEAGHVAQNIYLQSVSLNLGTVIIGAFDDEEVKKVMNMDKDEEPLCIMPVGK